MRRSILIASLVAAALLAVGGAAAARAAGRARRVGIGVRLLRLRAARRPDPSSTSVRSRSASRAYADGTAKGRYDYRQVRDGVELTVKGSLTCATIRGNQAWVGGVIEESSRPSLVGLEMWFQVQDNGKRARARPTCRRRSAPAGRAPGKQYCIDAPVVRFPFFLDQRRLLHVRD